MKVLVVGNGGREHALAWKLLQAPKVQQVTCIPGNGGTALLKHCQNLPLNVEDHEGIGRFALVNGMALVVIGPEAPLAAGLTDYLRHQHLTVFGPTRLGAQIESSKAWAKALMQEANIPTAQSVVFTEKEAAQAYVEAHGAPIVVKADGLAAGKGVTVATTVADAKAAIAAFFDGQFGKTGECILIEECLKGQEISVLALTDGITIRPLLPAQDHKRIGDGDTGLNTGGMGAYAPAPIATSVLMQRIQTEILEPTIAALRQRQIDYCGVLYAGLMITPEGDPKVIEFNCRFGDPEIQAILPLLETPLHELLLACAQKRLAEQPPIVWKSGVAACVVMAAEGYPGTFKKGDRIIGIADAEAQGAVVFHAGTQIKQQTLLTDGGRVLGVTVTDETFGTALSRAYTAVSSIQFDGAYYRHDIGDRVRAAETVSNV